MIFFSKGGALGQTQEEQCRLLQKEAEERACRQAELRASIDSLRLSKGLKLRFHALSKRRLLAFWPHRFFGLPSFEPTLHDCHLFSVWAVFLGPFYYFFTGMWRKALLACLIFLLLMVIEQYLSLEAYALEAIIIETYPLSYFFLSLSSLLMILLLCKGYSLLPFLLALGISFFVFITHSSVPYLHIGVSSAFMWMVGGFIALVFVMLSFVHFLRRNYFLLTVCLLHLLFFSFAGVPYSFEWYRLPTLAFALFLGSQGIWDRYRHSVLGERFWW